MPEITHATVSDRVKARMDTLGLRPEDVASRAGCSTQSVHNWLKSAENMRACNVRPLARALRCSPLYLLGLLERPGKAEPVDA